MKSLLFLIVLLVPAISSGEFLCSVDINYKWAKTEAKAAKDKEEVVPEESTVLWARVEQSGVDEATAKEKLASFVIRERQKASIVCKDLHENLSGCIAAKYAGAKSDLQTIDFGARKVLQDAIASDCKSQQGRCKEIEASEPKCIDKTPKKEDAVGDGKKDDKGKGAKKK